MISKRIRVGIICKAADSFVMLIHFQFAVFRQYSSLLISKAMEKCGASSY